MEAAINLAYVLAGVVVGGLLQAFTGFLTDRRSQKHEHEVWLRQRRLDAWTALNAQFETMKDSHGDKYSRFLHGLEFKFSELWTVTPRSVRSTVHEKWGTVVDALKEQDGATAGAAFNEIQRTYIKVFAFDNEPVHARTAWRRRKPTEARTK